MDEIDSKIKKSRENVNKKKLKIMDHLDDDQKESYMLLKKTGQANWKDLEDEFSKSEEIKNNDIIVDEDEIPEGVDDIENIEDARGENEDDDDDEY